MSVQDWTCSVCGVAHRDTACGGTSTPGETATHNQVVGMLQEQLRDALLQVSDMESVTADYLRVCKQRDDANRQIEKARKLLTVHRCTTVGGNEGTGRCSICEWLGGEFAEKRVEGGENPWAPNKSQDVPKRDNAKCVTCGKVLPVGVVSWCGAACLPF